MEYNGEFNPWPDETSMPKLSAQLYPDGDFYLTAGEKKLLAQVEEVYDKIVVVLNKYRWSDRSVLDQER